MYPTTWYTQGWGDNHMPTQADKITEIFQEEKEDDNPYYQP